MRTEDRERQGEDMAPQDVRTRDGATAAAVPGSPDASEEPREDVVETVRHGIDQVAAKVQRLLRSGD